MHELSSPPLFAQVGPPAPSKPHGPISSLANLQCARESVVREQGPLVRLDPWAPPATPARSKLEPRQSSPRPMVGRGAPRLVGRGAGPSLPGGKGSPVQHAQQRAMLLRHHARPEQPAWAPAAASPGVPSTTTTPDSLHPHCLPGLSPEPLPKAPHCPAP